MVCGRLKINMPRNQPFTLVHWPAQDAFVKTRASNLAADRPCKYIVPVSWRSTFFGLYL